jgi:uncharacterized protein (TIGR03067 family)
MTRPSHIFTAALLLAFTVRLAAQDAAAEKEQKSLQGNWDVTSAVIGGEESGVLKDGKVTFVFQKDKFTVKREDKVLAETSFTLALDAMPRLIDIKALSGDMKGATFQGIYELKENDLKLCLNLQGKDRPTEFVSKAGEQGVILILLKRIKE